MSDLLEDQKIAYIVKDYRRMFEMHEQLIAAVKEASEAIKHKDNRIRDLEKQVANLKNKSDRVIPLEKSGIIYDAAVKARDQFLSFEAKAKKGQELLNSLLVLLNEAKEDVELNTFEENESNNTL